MMSTMSKKEEEKGKKEKKAKRGIDFYPELVNKQVTIYMLSTSIQGEIIGDSIYQLKVKGSDGNIYYINKGHIQYVVLGWQSR